MSHTRAPSMGARTLTLTEELERLEQSITLTLQEIDHNFSKAHRIVTTSILPLVEQYGEQSKSVWEASKFWKQFFEASANVSLSGYEELAAGEGDETTRAEETVLDESISEYNNTTEADTTLEQSEYQDQQQQRTDADDDESLLDDATITGSTPRAPTTKSLRPQFADFGSPYEALRRELKGGSNKVFKDDLRFRGHHEGVAQARARARAHEDDDDAAEDMNADDDDTTAFKLPDMSMTPRSSSLLEQPTLQSQSLAATATGRTNKDVLLHRVLDKNYRIQATPHQAPPSPAAKYRARSPPKRAGAATTPAKPGETAEDKTRRALWADSPQSSPEMAVPKLRSDLYMSPLKSRGGRGGGPPRTPGVSVQTPATANKKRDIFAEARNRDASRGKGKGKGKEEEETPKMEAQPRGYSKWDDSDEEDEDDTGHVFGGMSPPKTIQFALPPSKLMQTPAREASRRIVDDILITAGEMLEEESVEYSPTMIRMNQDVLDDTF